MTKDEAIFHIKQLQKTYASMDKKVAEAVNMTIEALNNYQNCVKCEYYYETEDDSGVKSHCKAYDGLDFISRQAAIDKFNRFVERCKEKYIGRVVFTIDDAKYAFIKIVESVEPAHGEWVEDGCITKCKRCGEVQRFPHWHFCPNCGAKMKGGAK